MNYQIWSKAVASAPYLMTGSAPFHRKISFGSLHKKPSLNAVYSLRHCGIFSFFHHKLFAYINSNVHELGSFIIDFVGFHLCWHQKNTATKCNYKIRSIYYRLLGYAWDLYARSRDWIGIFEFGLLTHLGVPDHFSFSRKQKQKKNRSKTINSVWYHRIPVKK